MIHLTHFVFSYPQEPQFSQTPEEYDGGAIEDYVCQSSSFPVAVGDIYTATYHFWKNEEFVVTPRRWHVAEIIQYDAIGQDDITFSIAVLTFDGKQTKPDFDPDSCNILEISVTPENFKMFWPSDRKHCKNIGDLIWNEDYQVSRISHFITSDKYSYTQVRVLWCAPIENTAEEFAIA